MKKILLFLAVVAAMVGCQHADEPMVNANDNKIVVDASIVTDDTRVTVGGENYTEVNWEQGDVIRLESEKGLKTWLTATESGKSNVRFEGSGAPVAEVDTYYAVYPDMNVSNGTITLDYAQQFDYAQQSGDDVALLVATPVEGSLAGLQMSFSPVNALLHVKVNGGVQLAKAEFINYGTETDPNTGNLKYKDTDSKFTYNYKEDSITFNEKASALVVDSPSADGFFFRLAPGLDMSEGYIIRLTDASGNVCSKAYNGKVFERGTTTRVDIDWTQPSVTLGAKTSYSYYAAGYPATANKCGNTEIFFVTGKNGESCASSYAGVQDAMISDLGYEVDGATYTHSAGQVSWDKDTNTFCMISNPSYSTSWGEKSGIKAFIVVEGKKYYSNNNLWLTGLPYSYNFVKGSLDKYRSDGWSTNGDLRVANQSQSGCDVKLVLYSNLAGQKAYGYIVSPEFFVPNNVNVQPQIVRNVYATSGEISQTGYVGAVSSTTSKNTSSVTFSDNGSVLYSDDRILGKDSWLDSFQIDASNRYISISSTNNKSSSITPVCHYFLFEAHFRYAE